MKGIRRRPDHEADAVTVEADSISDPKKFRRSNDHHGNRVVAGGDVRVMVRKQHPGSREKDVRPDAGTELYAPGKDSEVVVEARRIGKVDHAGSRDRTHASMGVEIFGKMRRSRR